MNTRAGLFAFREIGRLDHALHQVTAEFVHLTFLAFRALLRRGINELCGRSRLRPHFGAGFCVAGLIRGPARRNHSGEIRTQTAKTPLESGAATPAEAGESRDLAIPSFPKIRPPVKRKPCFR
jgi:hypothetical protein